MTAAAVVGVDPGASTLGVVVRQGDLLLAWEHLGRGVLTPPAVWIRQVLEVVHRHVDVSPGVLVAVEGLTPPSSHLGRGTQVLAAYGATSLVLGALLRDFPDAIEVPPGGHGSAPLGAYPPQLRGARERKGRGALRHCRSAWDVAGAAVVLARWGVPGAS